MVAELRKVDKRLALYTDDDPVYKRLYRWPYTLYKAPYTKNGKLVGVDLYFDRQLRHTVVQVINGQLMLDI